MKKKSRDNRDRHFSLPTANTPLDSFCPLIEAAGEDGGDKGIAEITVIMPGFNTSKTRYYPASVLKRDFGIFEGAKMFADHPTASERRDRPERSVNNWVASLRNVTALETGEVRGQPIIIEDRFKSKLSNLRANGLLGQMGTSIFGAGRTKKTTVEGHKTELVEALVKAHSVDFVTYAGAGGRVNLYESDETNQDELEENDKMDEELKEMKERLGALEKQASETAKERDVLKAERDGAVAERDALKTKIEEAAKTVRIATAQKGIAKLIEDSKLPAPWQERLVTRFAESDTTDGVAETIEDMIQQMGELKEVGKVRGQGHTGGDLEEGDGGKTLYIEDKNRRILKGTLPEMADRMARSFSGYKGE